MKRNNTQNRINLCIACEYSLCVPNTIRGTIFICQSELENENLDIKRLLVIRLDDEECDDFKEKTLEYQF